MKCKHCGLSIIDRMFPPYKYTHKNEFINCKNAKANRFIEDTDYGTIAEPFEFKDYLKQAEDVASSKE